MNTPLLAGLFGAWTAVQIALGVFFLQAYAARRRESEYLLFGLVCFALSLTDAGFTLAYAVRSTERWLLASTLTNFGTVLASALNVHFVASYSRSRVMRRLVPAMYVISGVYGVVILGGWWWKAGSLRVVPLERLGVGIRQVVAVPTVAGALGYVIFMLAGVMTLTQLFVAYRAGKREARGAVIGHAVIVACATNDVLSVAGIVGTPWLLPYGFLIYGFGVADTLLVRYRRAAAELEGTASELRQATDELTNSYLELSVVQEELFRKRRLASVGELAASIAHEVRNPLAVIVNAAASLKRPGLGAEDRDTLFSIVEEEINRLNNIVTELVRYARPMNVRREEVSLADVVKSVVEGTGEKYLLDLHIAADPEVEMVWADPTLLRLAMQNIFDNARQAMPDGGSILVTAAKGKVADREGVSIEVTDTGHGMDSKTRRRSMDPFFSTRPSGTGLGLPIAGRIVEAHGGQIDVRSRLNEGTTVLVFIPIKRAELRHDAPTNTPIPRA